MAETRLKIAVFIDFDNIEIGVKTTLGGHFDVGAVLEAIKERGEVVTKIAYGDWTRAGDYSRSLTQHAIHMVQRNLTPGGDKNGADINLALDALEMAFTHSHINAFVIVGGDSDFMALVEKLKQYDRKVFVVGGRAFTSTILQRNCTEFIAYENVVGVTSVRKPGVRGVKSEATIEKAVPLVRRALKVLTDREVSPQLGVLKSTLLQLDSTFSEREYGASTFRDFVQRLARAGYVTLKGTDRNIYVELREGGDGQPASAAVAASGTGHGDTQHVDGEALTAASPTPLIDGETLTPVAAEGTTSATPTTHAHGGSHGHGASSHHQQPHAHGAASGAASTAAPSTSASTSSERERSSSASTSGSAAPASSSASASASPSASASAATSGGQGQGAIAVGPGPTAAGQAELIRLALDVFQRPGAVQRWPLYLRQVKQLLRAADESFDERKFGFSGIVEALRYCQREGIFRLDRDRQGVLRVYPGPVLQRANMQAASETADSVVATHESSDSAAASQDEQPREPKPMQLFRVTDAEAEAPAASGTRDEDAADQDAGDATADTVVTDEPAIEVAAGEIVANEDAVTDVMADAAEAAADATPDTSAKDRSSSRAAKSSRRKKAAAAAAPKAAKKAAAAAKSTRNSSSTARNGAAKATAARGRKNSKEKAGA